LPQTGHPAQSRARPSAQTGHLDPPGPRLIRAGFLERHGLADAQQRTACSTRPHDPASPPPLLPDSRRPTERADFGDAVRLAAWFRLGLAVMLVLGIAWTLGDVATPEARAIAPVGASGPAPPPMAQ
jgi:hypothetical protein